MLSAIIIGFIVGLVARMLMPGKDPSGFIITTVLGIVGALVATFIGQHMGYYQPNEPAGFIGSVLGAIILLALYRLVAGRRTTV